jgi:hypothetical protein
MSRGRPELLYGVLAVTVVFLGCSDTFLWPHGGALQVPHGLYATALAPYAWAMTATTWVMSASLVCWAMARQSASSLAHALTVFMPLMGVAGLSAAFSLNVAASLLYAGSWFLILASGAAAGLLLGYRLSVITLTSLGLLLIVACGVAHFAWPIIAWPPTWPQKIGTQFQGVFLGKQVCGWVMASLFIIAATARPVPLLRWAVALGALLVIWLTDSRISLICALLSSGLYGVAVPLAKRFWPARSWKLVAGVAVISQTAAIAIAVLSPHLATMLGRGENLDARVEIWNAYSNAIGERGDLGLGPGAFAQTGDITRKLYHAHLPPLWEYKTSQPSWWQSPHSVYLYYSGEVGWTGLAAFIAGLAYLAFVRPLMVRSSAALASGGLALQFLVGGLVEPSDGAYPGHVQLSLFLSLLFHAISADRERRPAQKKLNEM